MPDLSFPPIKSSTTPEAIIADDRDTLDTLYPPAPTALATPNTDDAGVIPSVETSVIPEPVSFNIGEAENSVDDATGLGLEAAAPPMEAAVATVDSVFFYGHSATGPVLYQVNLNEGTFIPVSEPVTLFPTVLSGLFTSEPGGLGGAGEASIEPPLNIFHLVEGTSDKNFLIGTDGENALFGLGSDDLILASSGDNLGFGGEGNDTLVGGAGDNGLFGGVGDDAIEGGVGDDLLNGGAGSDILYGGGGANTLVGGTEADVFRLNSLGAYDPLVGGGIEADIILDFNVAEGDLLDFSMIAAQPLFAGSDLLPSVSVVQIEADTHVQITTPLGQVSTEAILVGVEADTITSASFTFIPHTGGPPLK